MLSGRCGVGLHLPLSAILAHDSRLLEVRAVLDGLNGSLFLIRAEFGGEALVFILMGGLVSASGCRYGFFLVQIATTPQSTQRGVVTPRVSFQATTSNST